MSEPVEREARSMKYVLYNQDDGRILGEYTAYDAEQERCVECDIEEVVRAVSGASPELEPARFGVLEVTLEEAQEMKDLKVDPKKRKLVAQQPAGTRKK